MASAAAPSPAGPAAAPRGAFDRDHSSQSNFAEAVVTHSDLELDVEFGSQVLSGHVRHTVRARRDGVAELALDTSAGLAVKQATVNGIGVGSHGRCRGCSWCFCCLLI